MKYIHNPVTGKKYRVVKHSSKYGTGKIIGFIRGGGRMKFENKIELEEKIKDLAGIRNLYLFEIKSIDLKGTPEIFLEFYEFIHTWEWEDYPTLFLLRNFRDKLSFTILFFNDGVAYETDIRLNRVE